MPIATFDCVAKQASQSGLTIAPPNFGTNFDAAAIKAWLDAVNDAIDGRVVQLGLFAPKHIESLIGLRTLAMDAVLGHLYGLLPLPDRLALFAVGGYGRGELLPASDVDLLLIGDRIDEASAQIETLVAWLWDIGITPALAVRSLDDTKAAVRDHTIATAALEARLLAGNAALANHPYQAVKSIWSAKDFFSAKMDESKKRYLSQNATEYNLLLI